METWVDYYGILQVNPEAETEVVQSAYKQLCRKYHPDLNPSQQSAERMVALNEAYAVLGDTTRRRAYHQEWLRRRGFGSSPHQTAVRERVIYRDRPAPVPDEGSTWARRTVRDYFECLARRDFREAYALVCDADKKTIPFGAFVEWQESVGSLFELGRFELSLFKRHADFRGNGGERYRAEEYKVSVSEKNRATGQVKEYALTKYAVLEQGLWKVYLGYRDLTPIMKQFKYLATSQEDVQLLNYWEHYKATTDLTVGLPNKKGFETNILPEGYRNRRYARPVVVAVFQVRPPLQMTDPETVERFEKYAGYLIKHAVRATDQVGYFGDGLFGVVFSETAREQAELAVKRILRAARQDISACFDCDALLGAGLTEYTGQSLDSAIRVCLQKGRLSAAPGGARSTRS